MDLDAALRSTGAVREFRTDPVPDGLVASILDTARFAPSGGNRQSWRVVVVKDPAIRAQMRDLYLPGWYEYLAIAAAGMTPFSPLNDRDAEDRARAHAKGGGTEGFAERLDEVPVMLALFADLHFVAAVDRDHPPDRHPLAAGASVYPFAWSILLAAHDAGLGGVMTTMNLRRDTEVRTLLHAPDHLALAAVLALGWPVQRAVRLRRQPVERFATVDTVDGPPFGAAS